MDIAVYIKELLVLHGELSIPGLGYFATVRVNGYYNKEEGRFYPPADQVRFDPQTLDNDDTLAEYITKNKNISLASSKYFVDKYVIALKEKATSGSADMPGLGNLTTVDGRLTFSPDNNADENDGLFDYPPVNIKKTTDEPVFQHSAPKTEDRPPEASILPNVPADKPGPVVVDEPEPDPVIATPSPTTIDTIDAVREKDLIAADTKTGDFPEVLNLHSHNEAGDEPAKRSVNIWLILMTIVAIAAIALVAIYRYQPSLFGKFTKWKHKEAIKPLPKPVLRRDSVKRDTIAELDTGKAIPAVKPADTATVKTASSAPVQAAPKNTVQPDGIPTGAYVMLGGAFARKSEALKALKNYQNRGFTQIKMLDKASKGKYYKILFGVYKSHGEASAEQRKLINTGKIKAGETIIQPYKTKK
jgi:cell division septation protein DedD